MPANGLLHAGALAPVAPLLAALWRRQGLTPARGAVLGWCVVLLVADAVALTLGRRGVNNHWVSYASAPVGFGLLLWALAAWQTRAFPRLVIRVAIPCFVAVWVALVAFVERTDSFSVIVSPFGALSLLVTSLGTLLARSMEHEGSLLEADWFWITLGLVLYHGGLSGITPVSALLLRSQPELVVRAYQVLSVSHVAACLIIARGFLCPNPVPSSGGPSWRPSWPSRSSSPPSGWRW